MQRRTLSSNPIVEKVRQLQMIKDQKATLDKRYQDLRSDLEEDIKEHGAVDETGSLVLPLAESVGSTTKLVWQRRAKVNLNADMLTELLEDKGLYEDCTRTVTVLDEDKVRLAIFEGKLSEAEFERCTEVKESWALVESK